MDIYEEIVRLRQAGRKGALATIVHTQGSIPSYQSSKLLVPDDRSFPPTPAPPSAAGPTCGGTLEIYVEPIPPQPVCSLFGGGHVSLAVARLAAQAGFGVVVVDDRPRFANRERFPEAAAVYA